MADYMKVLLRLLLSVSVVLHCSVATEDRDVTCGFPGAPAYGYLKPDQVGYDEDDVVTYTCRVGYILLGAPISRCTEDGSWTEDVPICDDSMTTLGVASSTPTLPGHSAEMAVDRDRDTCTYMKPKKPRWWRIDLGGLHKILSVAITMVSTDKSVKFTVYVVEIQGQSASYKRCASFTGRFGSQTIVLACAEGKGLAGQKVHVEDHRLEDFFEICEVEVQVEKDIGYDCGRPDRSPFSMTDESDESDDDEVEYSCKTGYELVGDSKRECLSSGQWSGEAPTCKPIVCESLGSLENGELSYSIINGDTPLEGSTANYKCNYGYMSDGDITRLCLKDGSWSGKAPVCKVIRCPVPEGKHAGETYRLLNKTNRVGSIAKLRCRKGITIGDDPHITCTVKGEWTEQKAECLLPDGSTMEMQEPPRIVNRGGIIFGMAVAVIMMVIILVSCYIVKRRRDANRPQLPSRQHDPLVPPPRPPPRAKGLKSALIDLVSRDSSGYKYESLTLDDASEGKAAWKTRSLPLEPGNDEGTIDDLGAPRRALSYDDPQKLALRGKDTKYEQGQPDKQPETEVSEKETEKQDTSEKDRVTTPVSGTGEYAAVDYDKKRQSRLLKEQDSEERSQGTSSAADGEQLRELPPIPKEEEEEEEARVRSAASRSSDKEREQDEEKKGQDTEEAASEESEDVSLPIAPSESQTSEAPTPSPDVVIENQVEEPSASPTTPPPEITPGRRRRRGAPEQPSTEDAPEARRTRTRRRTEPEEPESPPAPPVEEERPTRRTRPWAASRFETPSTTTQPTTRRRY